MEQKFQKSEADFLIKQKQQDGKNRIVGRGWKKTSSYGTFISLSIGTGNDRQSYIMVKAEPRDESQVPPPPPPPPKKEPPSDPFGDL